ncbi:unnamed protein product [Cunninghamella echinulata]
MVSFILIVNKKSNLCVNRPSHHTLFFKYEGLNIVYRNYASLYIIVGSTKQENEFSILEWIQLFVETMDTYFDRVTELDLLFQLEKVHMIIEELLPKGIIGETSQERILSPFLLRSKN